jgi:hypothetical protein
MKTIIKQFDIIAKDYLSYIQKHLNDKQIVVWCQIHGWTADSENIILLTRQMLLNSVIRHIFPNLTLHKIPFDFINVPESLIEKIQEVISHSRSFNFWGDLYNALIPQPKRRYIGQFWTDELIAEWMVSWLFQFQPKLLVDVGCGSGNFLLKSAQYQQNNCLNTKFCGIDVSPLLLNLTQAAFSTFHFPFPELT